MFFHDPELFEPPIFKLINNSLVQSLIQFWSHARGFIPHKALSLVFDNDTSDIY